MQSPFVYDDANIEYSEDCQYYKFTLIDSASYILSKEKALQWLKSEIQALKAQDIVIKGEIFDISNNHIVVKLLSLSDSFLLLGENYTIKVGKRTFSGILSRFIGSLAEFTILNQSVSSKAKNVEIHSNSNILMYELSAKYISEFQGESLNLHFNKIREVIDGPPGSGKTSELAKIIKESEDKRILILSLSNVAVDNILNRIKILNPVKIGIKKFFDNVKYFDEVRDGIEDRIVGMTLASFAIAVHKNLIPSTFDMLIIDEASMIPFALGILPFYFAKEVIIAGDNRQLKPIVLSTPLNTYPAWESLMRVAVSYAKSAGKYRYLKSQYRGRKEIYDIIAEAFYTDVGLQVSQYNKKEYNYSREGDIFDEVLNEKCGITWVQIKGAKEKWKNRSAYNEIEAALVSLLYQRLENEGIKDIGIITNFRAQANLLQKALGIQASHLGFSQDNGLDYSFGEYISTVDGFQGGEKLVVLYSLVLSKIHESVRDFRRINVALSRAKEKLIVISSMEDIDKLPFLCFIKSKCQKSKCYYELTVRDLEQNSEFLSHLEKIK